MFYIEIEWYQGGFVLLLLSVPTYERQSEFEIDISLEK